MEKLKKRRISLLLELEFKAVKSFQSSNFYYLLISSFHIFFLAINFFEILNPSLSHELKTTSLTIPYRYIFITTGTMFGAYVLFSIPMFSKNFLLNFWGYSLLFFQAISGMCIEMCFRCVTNDNWCQNQTKFEVIVFLVLVPMLISVVVLRVFYYYPFHDVSNLLSTDTGFSTLILFVYKLCMSAICNLPSIRDDKTVQKAALFACNMLLYLCCHNKYHNHQVAKQFWNNVYVSCAWISLLVFLGPLMSWFSSQSAYSELEVLKYITIFSLPLVLFLSYNMQFKSNFESFFKFPRHKISDKELMFNILSHVILELNNIKKSELKCGNPKYKQLLQLMKQHEDICQMPSCPMKNRDTDSTIRQESIEEKKLNKNIQLCIMVAQQILENIQNKYPNLLEIIIFGAYFSFETQRIKQKALFLYNQQVTKKPSLSNFYALLFLRQKVEHEGGLRQDMTGQSNQNMLSEFQHNIQMSVSMLAEFWYLLSDPKCNLKKLYDLANVIFPLKIEVDNMWERMAAYKNIHSYNLYAKYLVELFNDREKGLKILEQAKKIDDEIRNRKEINVGLEVNNNIADENGVIFLELDESKSGTMYQTNLAAEKMFGYNKGEFLKRKVNDIMPRTYSLVHDQILENYQQTNKTAMMNKERQIWGKSKNGYLFPFTILIKPIKNFYSEKTEIYASLKKDLWLKEVALIVVNNNYIITDVSSSILNIYPNLTAKTISKGNIYVQDIVEDFDDIINKNNEGGTTMKSNTIEISRSFLDAGRVIEETISVTITIQQINVAVCGKVGYLIKLVRNNSYSRSEQTNRKDPVDFSFCPSYARPEQADDFQALLPAENNNNSEYIVRYVGFPTEESEKICDIIQSDLIKTVFNKRRSSTCQGSGAINHFVDYSTDIRCKRLVDNALREVHSEGTENESDYDAMREEQEQLKGDLNNIRNSELTSILSKESGNPKINIMKILTLVMVLVSSALIVCEYFLSLNYTHSIQSNLEDLRLLNQMVAQICYLDRYVLLFGGSYGRNPTLSERTTFIQDITNLDDIQKMVTLKQNVTLFYGGDSSVNNQTLFLNFAINKLISEANYIKSMDTMNVTHASIQFVKLNAINQLVSQAQLEIDQLAAQNKSDILDMIHFYEIFLYLALPILTLFTLIKNVVLQQILTKKSEILQVFFEIPRRTCKGFQKKCERFIQKLAVQDNQENEDEMATNDEEEFENQDNSNQQRKKKRSIKGKDKTKFHFFLGTLAFALFLSVFHLVEVIYARVNEDRLNKISQIMVLMSSYQPFSALSINAIVLASIQSNIIRSFLYITQNTFKSDPTIPILGSTTTAQALANIESTVQKYSNIDLEYQSVIYHTINSLPFICLLQGFFYLQNYLSSDFIRSYNEILFQSACNFTNTPCPDVDVPTVDGLDYHLSALNQYLIQLYSQVQAQPSQPPPITDQEVDYQISQQLLIRNSIRQLTHYFLDDVNGMFATMDTSLFSVMLTMVILNILSFLFGWIHFFNMFEKKIAATEYILTFIPINQINRNPKIALYIKQEILDKK